MNVQWAIDTMRQGRYVARSGWGHRQYVYLVGEEFTYSSNGYDSSFVIAHVDLLAEDWQEITPER